VVCLVTWGVVMRSRYDPEGAATENGVFVGLLVLAALALGAFLTCALIKP
jgi:hypothetical protein